MKMKHGQKFLASLVCICFVLCAFGCEPSGMNNDIYKYGKDAYAACVKYQKNEISITQLEKTCRADYDLMDALPYNQKSAASTDDLCVKTYTLCIATGSDISGNTAKLKQSLGE